MAPDWQLPAICFLLLALTSSVGATTVVVPPDAALVDQADLIVRGTVLAIVPAPGLPRTDILISPSKTLKGRDEAMAMVTMRVLGGEAADGHHLRVWGSPDLGAGEEVLLFLRAGADGTYSPLHLMLGVFRLVGTEEDGFAVRDLREITTVRLPGVDSPDERMLRHWGAFESWIVQRAAGEAGEPIYWQVPSPWQSMSAPFTLFVSTKGNNIRWFEFDEGKTISWSMRLPEFEGSNPSLEQLEAAIEIWNETPRALIHYAVAGTTEATGGLTKFDGVNAVVFGDPNNEVDGTFSCVTGGVLAIGGPWFSSSSTTPFKNRMVHRTAGADVIYNDGVECIAKTLTALKNFEEVLGHELGHTLGIGHSCGDSDSGPCQGGTLQNDALMRATAHLDGRGARLNHDDIAAAFELYPDPSAAPLRKRSVRRP